MFQNFVQLYVIELKILFRNQSINAYISDYLILNYLRLKQTDCDLQMVVDEFFLNGYALAFSKHIKQKEKVAQLILIIFGLIFIFSLIKG